MTPPEGYSIIPRAYLEAGNPLPGDAMFSTKTGAWIDSHYRYSRVPHEANEDGIDFYATAQPLPCFFQKGGDEPCAQKETESLSGITPPTPPGNGSEKKRTSASNAPVAIRTQDQGPEHNPNGLTPEQYGAPEWRLLRKGEPIEEGDQMTWAEIGRWHRCYDDQVQLQWSDLSLTFRRRVAPEPAAPTVHPDTVARFAEIDAAEKRIAELKKRLADIEGPEPYTEEILERRDLVCRINLRDRRIAELERELAAVRTAAAEELGKLIKVERERDEARAKTKETAKDFEMVFRLARQENDSLRSIVDEAERAIAQLAASERDRERLDWLQQNWHLIQQPNRVFPITNYIFDPRTAIDIAMKEAK